MGAGIIAIRQAFVVRAKYRDCVSRTTLASGNSRPTPSIATAPSVSPWRVASSTVPARLMKRKSASWPWLWMVIPAGKLWTKLTPDSQVKVDSSRVRKARSSLTAEVSSCRMVVSQSPVACDAANLLRRSNAHLVNSGLNPIRSYTDIKPTVVSYALRIDT